MIIRIMVVVNQTMIPTLGVANLEARLRYGATVIWKWVGVCPASALGGF
jgi:hypothetical protein